MGSPLSILSRRGRDNDQSGRRGQGRRGLYVFDQNQQNGIFDNQYIMGGQKFETTDPQRFLFGSISDLNYLGPYGPSGSSEHNLPKINHRLSNNRPGYVQPINVLINLRKHSIRLVRAPSLGPTKEESEREEWFHVEFIVDCSVPCTARIHYLVKETPKGQLVPTSTHSTKSDQLEFEGGMDHQFCLLTHRVCPGKIMSTETASDDKGRWTWANIPAVIQLKTKDTSDQIHLTYCTFEKNNQGNWTIKTLKQRVRIGRFSFCLQEIYGIEQKAEGEEAESECAICWDEPRDTLILPCRHLAVCAECAEKIRYQQAACPICRKPFKALLKLHIQNVEQEPLMEILNNLPNEILQKQTDKNRGSPDPEPKTDKNTEPEGNDSTEKSPKEKKDLNHNEETKDSGDPPEEVELQTQANHNSKVSQDSGIALPMSEIMSSTDRRESELSMERGEGDNLIGKASDDSGASADSTNHLLNESPVRSI